MKVITKCVIDMDTMETVYEESFENDGPVAECKGGSTGYDAEYNRRMAEIAEQQMAMAQTAFDAWQTGGGLELENATAQAGLSLLPGQTALAQGQIDSALTLLPGQTELAGAQTSLGLQKVGNQSSIMDKFYASLGNNSEIGAMNEAGSNMASTYSAMEKAGTMGLQRRGLAPTATNTAAMTSDKAKAIGLAQQNALTTTRQQNKDELYKGLTI